MFIAEQREFEVMDMNLFLSNSTISYIIRTGTVVENQSVKSGIVSVSHSVNRSVSKSFTMSVII